MKISHLATVAAVVLILIGVVVLTLRPDTECASRWHIIGSSPKPTGNAACDAQFDDMTETERWLKPAIDHNDRTAKVPQK